MNAPLGEGAGSPLDLAARLERNAELYGAKAAIIYPDGRERDGSIRYKELSYRVLQQRVRRVADGFSAIGINRGTRTVVLATGPEVFIIAFALFRLGAVPVVVDPGIGVRRVLHCYRTARATAFVGPPAAHILRLCGAGVFRDVRVKVTIGRRWFWGGNVLSGLPDAPADTRPGPPDEDDLSMIVFTTGATGPPKGVEYTHRAVGSMARQVRDSFGHAPDGVSLVTVPSHGLFDLLVGSTMVLAPVRPGRVASADPAAVTEALQRFGVTAMFMSPALLESIADYLVTRPVLADDTVRLPCLRSVVSGGAPVSPSLAVRLRMVLSERARVHVTYGATEALLICSIESSQLLTVAGTGAAGPGSCVGRPVAGTEVRIVGIRDGKLGGHPDDTRALPAGQIGEVLVAGESVSRRYHADPAANAFRKVTGAGSDPGQWHRTGDTGYMDQEGRLWLCGRVIQRVRTASGDLYTLPCEAVFNAHRLVRRSALVGIGGADGGYQTPVVCVQTRCPLRSREWDQLVEELGVLARADPAAAGVRLFLRHPGFPVDARHNAKIRREVLAAWAARRISVGGDGKTRV